MMKKGKGDLSMKLGVFSPALQDKTLEEALTRMAKNTRVYAKKQLTWLRRDASIHWLTADDLSYDDLVERIIGFGKESG